MAAARRPFRGLLTFLLLLLTFLPLLLLTLLLLLLRALLLLLLALLLLALLLLLRLAFLLLLGHRRASRLEIAISALPRKLVRWEVGFVAVGNVTLKLEAHFIGPQRNVSSNVEMARLCEAISV